MEYSKRVVEIIEKLLEKSDFLSIAQLADEMNISKRTIFRDMDEIEAFAKDLGLVLTKKSKLGLKVEADVKQREQVQNYANKFKGTHFSQEERLNQIIMELLRSREPRKFYYFSNLLGVSEATISYDMDKIEPWFKERSITLVRKPGFGVFVKGKEIDFRKAIVDFLYQNYEHQDLVAMISSTNGFVENVMDKEISLKVSKILSKYETYIANRLTDQSYMGLMIHLSIAVQRILRGESIIMNGDILDNLRSDSQFDIARSIGVDIEKEFTIKFPEDELGYITMHLKGSKLRTGALIDQQDLIISNFELSRLSSAMIQKFKELSGYDLKEDEKLLIGLVSHLRPAVTRMKLALDIRNPLLEKIMEMYPEIYKMSSETGTLIAKQFDLNVPKEEVGYIAMHFGAAVERYLKLQGIEKKIRTGVVCSSGIGTSSLLYSRLVKLFPRLEVVGQFSKEDVIYNRISEHQLELLITTIALDASELPSIQVNPLLMTEDIERIKQVVSILSNNVRPYKSQLEREKQDESESVKRIHALTESVITIERNLKLFRDIKAKNSEQLLKQIADANATDSKHKKQIISVLQEREKLGSTVLQGEGIALIHGKSEVIKEMTFSVWRLVKPITMQAFRRNELVDKAVVMLIPENASKVQLEVMSLLSKALVEDNLMIQMISDADEKLLLDHIKGIMHKWLNRQLKTGGL
ncbi:MAG: hypothetical protein BGO41_03070 [Clostridiales bacterium 38-18]|nr:MAG: hypothetical protein BGO41_03070 [Clostridiales bacterium 38-18]